MSGIRSIQPWEEAVYIHGILFSTSAAVSEIEHYDRLVDAKSDDIELLNCLQEIVTHLAAVSRYLWPSKNHAWRGDRIRAAFKIDDSSPLKSRAIRNAIEHIDERIDRALENGFVGMLYPAYVGPTLPDDGVNKLFFRAYFTDTASFQILGETYDLGDIRTAIKDLHDELVAAISYGGRFPTA